MKHYLADEAVPENSLPHPAHSKPLLCAAPHFRPAFRCPPWTGRPTRHVPATALRRSGRALSGRASSTCCLRLGPPRATARTTRGQLLRRCCLVSFLLARQLELRVLLLLGRLYNSADWRGHCWGRSLRTQGWQHQRAWAYRLWRCDCCWAPFQLPQPLCASPSAAPPDLLALQCLPEWPAANVLLRLFAKELKGSKVGWLRVPAQRR